MFIKTIFSLVLLAIQCGCLGLIWKVYDSDPRTEFQGQVQVMNDYFGIE